MFVQSLSSWCHMYGWCKYIHMLLSYWLYWNRLCNRYSLIITLPCLYLHIISSFSVKDWNLLCIEM